MKNRTELENKSGTREGLEAAERVNALSMSHLSVSMGHKQQILEKKVKPFVDTAEIWPSFV